MANFRKKLFLFLADLSGSPLDQTEAVAFLADATGIGPKLLRSQAKAMRASQATQVDPDAPSIEEATEGMAHLAPRRYWKDTGLGEWAELTHDSAVLRLRERGLSPKKQPAEELSSLERGVIHLQDARRVHYAGPLTAWPVGLHTDKGTNFLVTRQPAFITPRQGDPSPYLNLVKEVVGVGTDPHGETQFHIVLGWLRQWLFSLRNHQNHIPGQILLLGGPPGLGKGYFTMITGALGGDRCSDASKGFVEGARFNAELAGVTLAGLHDSALPSDLASVNALWGKCKKLVADRDHSIEGKHVDARTLPLAGLRTVVTCNFGEEASRLLAPVILDDGMSDKVILLRGYPPNTPRPATGTPEAIEATRRILASLPAVAWYLGNEYQLPSALRDAEQNRYGVASWHHPDLVGIIRSAHPDNPLGDLLDSWLLQMATAGHSSVWEGTATDLFTALKTTFGPTFSSLTTRPQHLGHQLSRLRKQPGWGERLHDRSVWVGARQNQERRVWRVAPLGQTATPPAP